jgi:hypothetical protein
MVEPDWKVSAQVNIKAAVRSLYYIDMSSKQRDEHCDFVSFLHIHIVWYSMRSHHLDVDCV